MSWDICAIMANIVYGLGDLEGYLVPEILLSNTAFAYASRRKLVEWTFQGDIC